MVADRLSRLEKEMGGMDDSSSSAGKESRVDILEDNIKKLQDWCTTLSFDDDLKKLSDEILEIHDKDLSE